MLKDKDIKTLNQFMIRGIGTGEGYALSEYFEIAVLSRLDVEYNLIERYVILSHLNKNKNRTLLKAYRDNIDLAYIDVKREIDLRYTEEEQQELIPIVCAGKHHTYWEYNPFPMKFLGTTETSIKIGLRERISAGPLMKYGISWQRDQRGKYYLDVPFRNAREVINALRRIGVVGHVPTMEIENEIEKWERNNRRDKNISTVGQKRIMVTLGEKSAYGNDMYEINSHDAELIASLWEVKDRAVKYIDARTYNDKVIVHTNKVLFPCLKMFCASHNIEMIEMPNKQMNKEETCLGESIEEITEDGDRKDNKDTVDEAEERLVLAIRNSESEGNNILNTGNIEKLSDNKQASIKNETKKEQENIFEIASKSITTTSQEGNSTAEKRIDRVKSRGIVLSEQEEQEIIQLPQTDKMTNSLIPYEYQIEDAELLLKKNRGILGHEMGCGKTIIMILAASQIEGNKIIVCPESLRLNWKREIERMLPDEEVGILYSKARHYMSGGKWTIMGYQTASKFAGEICRKGIACLIVDEAHNIKSVDSKGRQTSARARAIMQMSNYSERVYLLTGTPMPTRSKDLYNMMVILGEIDTSDPYAFHRYGLRYCDAKETPFGWNYNGNSNREELHKLLNKHMIRRLKKDVLPHLKKQRQFIPVAQTSAKYRLFEKEIISASTHMSYLGKTMTGRRLLSEAKIQPAIDLANNLLNAEESIVIVTEFKDTLEKLMEYYGKRACKICGGMSDKEKQRSIDDFQNGDKSVCIINLIAGGTGITLTKAHNMIICDYDWTPSNMVQVEDRICRNGQDESCNIYYLYCEESILDRAFIKMITQKSETIDRVVDNTDNTTDFERGVDGQIYLEFVGEEIRVYNQGLAGKDYDVLETSA